MFAVFVTKDHAVLFYNYINRQHSNKFPVEPGKDGKLPFLDTLVCNKPNLVICIYRKPTYTGLLTNFFSFTPSKYKIGLFKICWMGVTKSATHGKVLITIWKIWQKFLTRTSFQLNLLVRSQNSI